MAKNISQLKKRKQLQGRQNIIIAIWTGEELGLLGSSYFIEGLQKQTRIKITAVINLDMIGHLQQKLIIQGTGSSEAWPNLLNNIAQTVKQQIQLQKDPFLPTDSTAFYIRGVPAINFFSGAFSGYHSPEDTYDTLNFAGIKKVSNFLCHLVVQLEKRNQPIQYAVVKKKDYVVNGRFKIFLGTIPDYASDEIKGVKLSGILPDSPAAKAGLKAQDVIISLDNNLVANLQDYTILFNKIEPYKLYKIEILRNGRQKSLTIVPLPRTKNA